MTGPADYTGYALYREAVDAFGDPVFARWICRGYPWGGVDLNRAHQGFLLARDGVTMTGGDARTVLSLLVSEVTTLEHRIDHEGQAAVLGPSARALRRLMTDIRRLANAHPAHAEFRLRCPCSAGDGEFSGAHEDSLPQADPLAALTLRTAARQIAGARNTPAALDRNEALDSALGLVQLALYQLGSAEGAEAEMAQQPPLSSRRSGSERRSTMMAVLEFPDYRAARERLQGNPVIAMMAAGVATVPLAELADEDGTPRSHLMNLANRGFDDAEARNAGNPAYTPYPKDAHRHLGLIAEAVLAERAAMRAAVASAMASPGTDHESAVVTSIIERMRAGESALAIARETGAIREPGLGEPEGGTPGD